MATNHTKETVGRIISIISERPGVIHFHVATEPSLKSRELDVLLCTVGTRDYRLLHYEER